MKEDIKKNIGIVFIQQYSNLATIWWLNFYLFFESREYYNFKLFNYTSQSHQKYICEKQKFHKTS